MNEVERQVRAAALAEPQLGPGGIVAQEFRFQEGFIGFDGHFPGRPTLPAFVQLMMARIALEAAFGGCRPFVGIKSSRFTRVIRPLETARIECAPSDTVGAWQIELRVGDEVAARAKIVIGQGGTDRVTR